MGNFPELTTVFKEVVSNRYCKLRAVIPESEKMISKNVFHVAAFFSRQKRSS
jgi:hypothetical protein